MLVKSVIIKFIKRINIPYTIKWIFKKIILSNFIICISTSIISNFIIEADNTGQNTVVKLLEKRKESKYIQIVDRNDSEIYDNNSNKLKTNNEQVVRMILVAMKIKKRANFKDNLLYMNEGVEKAVYLVKKQAEDGIIAGVIEFIGSVKR